jgi:hypothetical protein
MDDGRVWAAGHSGTRPHGVSGILGWCEVHDAQRSRTVCPTSSMSTYSPHDRVMAWYGWMHGTGTAPTVIATPSSTTAVLTRLNRRQASPRPQLYHDREDHGLGQLSRHRPREAVLARAPMSHGVAVRARAPILTASAGVMVTTQSTRDQSSRGGTVEVVVIGNRVVGWCGWSRAM